jgi:hypothetical protein
MGGNRLGTYYPKTQETVRGRCGGRVKEAKKIADIG